MHHFDQRCIDRGIASIRGNVLRANLERAIRENRVDLMEMVFHIDATSTLWRFRVAEGLFYAVCGRHSRKCITLFTPEMVKQLRARRRYLIRNTGKRELASQFKRNGVT